jgi:hypothetical protein
MKALVRGRLSSPLWLRSNRPTPPTPLRPRAGGDQVDDNIHDGDGDDAVVAFGLA